MVPRPLTRVYAFDYSHVSFNISVVSLGRPRSRTSRPCGEVGDMIEDTMKPSGKCYYRAALRTVFGALPRACPIERHSRMMANYDAGTEVWTVRLLPLRCVMYVLNGSPMQGVGTSGERTAANEVCIAVYSPQPSPRVQIHHAAGSMRYGARSRHNTIFIPGSTTWIRGLKVPARYTTRRPPARVWWLCV
jgi:hypothetical protein